MKTPLFIGVLVLMLFWAATVFPCDDIAIELQTETDGKALFKRGLEELSSGRYDEALRDFEVSHIALPEIGDYALFYAAQAALKTGQMERAVLLLEKILAEYPKTLLRKKASKMLIKTLLEAGSERAIPLLETYIKDYQDNDMIYLLGKAISDKDPERAKSLFLEVYINAGPFSEAAYKEISPTDITPTDIVKRARNLIKTARYQEAESALSSLLETGQCTGTDCLNTLAISLFRQKKYTEAGRIFLKTQDFYNAALSFFRAGQYTYFDEAIKELTSSKDSRVGELLVSYAADLRRKGDVAGALKILSDVINIYPDEKENALWQIAWTQYINGEYKNAASSFAELTATYNKSKYIYWAAKNSEHLGENASHLYSRIQDKSDYYGLLARLKTSPQARVIKTTLSPDASEPDKTLFTRYELLTELGLKSEAAEELLRLASTLSARQQLIEIAKKLKEAGQYKKAIALIALLPENERPPDVTYPLAYWTEVKNSCQSIALDPYLVLSVIREESRYDPEALSQAGAIGLMQLMPVTARRIARTIDTEISTEKDIYDAGINIRLGSIYLGSLVRDFGSVPYALAAYNAGEHKVRQWLTQRTYKSHEEFIEDIPYKETREYVKRVLTTYYRYKELSRESLKDTAETAGLPDLKEQF